MSSSSSFGSSTSTPVVPPEELVTQGILNQIAGISTQMAQQMMSWGQQIFNNASAVTSTTIPQYMSAAASAFGGAGTAMGEFMNKYIPLNNQLTEDAESYASPSRIALNMGEAESQQTQAGQAALEKTRQQLEASGIDTSSGRYADLLKSENLSSAAAAAGAGNQAEVQTENTGRQMRAQALANDIQMPAIAANFLNSGQQALTGASNAALGTANTWANVAQVPNAYLSTAMQDKYPPIGNRSSSFQTSSSSHPDPNNSNSRNSGGNQGGGNGSQGGNGNGTTMGPGPNGTPVANPSSTHFGGGNGVGAGPHIFGGNDSNGMDVWDPGVNGQSWDQYGADTGSIYQGGYNDPYSSMYGGYNYSETPGQNSGGYDDSSYSSMDPYAQYNAGNYDQSSDPWGSAATNGSAGGGGDWGSGQAYNDFSSAYSGDQTDYGAQGDYSFDPGGGGYSDYGGDYARGGTVKNRGARPTTGGYAPPSASPTGGRATDDIPARLNAGEYVIPRDVVGWKGHEFFDKLIKGARKARGEPAGPTPQGKPKPPLAGPPTFQSRGYDDGGDVQPIPSDDVSTEQNPFGPQGSPTPPKSAWQRFKETARDLAVQDNGYRQMDPTDRAFQRQQGRMNQYQAPNGAANNGVIPPSQFQDRNASRFGNQQGITPQDFYRDDDGNLITGQASPALDI